MTEDEYLCVDEAAKFLGRSESTAWRLIRQYKLETFTRPLDRRTYVRKSDLEAIKREVRPKRKTEAA